MMRYRVLMEGYYEYVLDEKELDCKMLPDKITVT